MSLLTNWLENLAGEIELTPACLRAQSPKSTCAKCLTSCPEQAIALSEAGATINPALCTTCGACVPTCPVQAIHGRSPERRVTGNTLLLEEGPFPVAQELLYFYKKGVNTLDFGPKNPAYPDALQIADSLLADIGLPSFNIVPSLPAGKYRREGSEREVLMLNDMLADGSGLDGSVQGLSMLNDKLEGCSGLEGSLQETSMLNVMQEGCSGRVSPVHGIFPPDSTSQPSSRRQFFHHAFRETTKIAAKTLTPSKWRFNHSEFNMARMFTEVSLHEVDLDRSSCTLCEACFKLCKQRIFTIKGDTLEICHAKCNGCGLCADVCDSKAVRIRLKAHRVLREELPLNQDVCTECGSAYPGWPENRKADSTCPPCESRKQFGYLNPFCT